MTGPHTDSSNITGKPSEHSLSMMDCKCLLHKLVYSEFSFLVISSESASIIDSRETQSRDSERGFFISSPTRLKRITGDLWSRRCGNRHSVGGLDIYPECDGHRSHTWGHNNKHPSHRVSQRFIQV